MLRYKGGPAGLYGLADAFNPWDIVKMTARGFRWLFVGSRKRHDDISYQNHLKMDPAYSGPTFAGSGEAATELRPSGDGRGRSDTVAEDDRAGLLRHSGQIGGRMPSASPYRTNTGDDYNNPGYESQMDLGRPPQQRQPPPGTAVSSYDFDAKPSEFMDDTSYRPGFAPGSSAAAGAGAGAGGLSGEAVHPAFRQGVQGQGQYQDWNVFGGASAQQQSGGDADSIRPPTYRTRDPHR